MKSLLLKEGQVKFNIFLPFQKSFQITDEQPEMPEKFASLQLDQGYYVWGYASVPTVDLQGDFFPMETLSKMAPGLTRPPYNKIFLNHDYEDIAHGTIIATTMDDKGMLVLAKLNEEHSRAQEVWGSIMNQTLDGFSMGGSFIEVETIEDESTGMTFNVVREAVSTEVSMTSAPVNGESLMLGAFKKSKDIFNLAEDRNFNKSLKIEMKGDDKKFFINEEFMKSMKTEVSEKYIKNKILNKSMVDKKELNEKQKEVFDKAISDGKTEDEAMKLASSLLDKQAIEGAESKSDALAENPMKTGAENTATKKKELKKSIEDETPGESEDVINERLIDTKELEETIDSKEGEEVEAKEEKEEKSEAEKIEDLEKEKLAKSEEDTEEESEELESAPVDYKAKYEKSLKKIEQLESELAPFKKSLPGNESEEPEAKPLRKSVKTKQTSEIKATDGSQSPKSKTPFLEWINRG